MATQLTKVQDSLDKVLAMLCHLLQTTPSEISDDSLGPQDSVDSSQSETGLVVDPRKREGGRRVHPLTQDDLDLDSEHSDDATRMVATCVAETALDDAEDSVTK